jgi:hypothetical protein
MTGQVPVHLVGGARYERGREIYGTQVPMHGMVGPYPCQAKMDKSLS